MTECRNCWLILQLSHNLMSNITTQPIQATELRLEPRPIVLETRVKYSDGQMAADLGGELAILNLKTGIYFGLDEVGARIWSLVNEKRTVREIRDVIMDEYAVDGPRCESDLVRLLTELARHELIEICDKPDSKI